MPQRRIERVWVLVVRLLVVLVLACSRASATEIDPLEWQQIAFHADFIGEVECIEAGGITARYRVVSTWKGTPKTDDVLSIRTPPNYWGPQYPVSFVGERVIVAGYAHRSAERLISTTSGGPVPLWWRDLPADYRLPLFQGLARIDSPYRIQAAFGTQRADVGA